MTFGICFKQHCDTRYLVFYNPSSPRMFLSLDLLSERSDSTWCHRTPLCYIQLLNLDILQGSFRLCNWLSLRRLVSWINHLPPACWSTFWKSISKHQFGCRFDILDSISSCFCILTYAIIYVLIHHLIVWLYLYFLNILFFSSTPVLTSSIDVVYVLSIRGDCITCFNKPQPLSAIE